MPAGIVAATLDVISHSRVKDAEQPNTSKAA